MDEFMASYSIGLWSIYDTKKHADLRDMFRKASKSVCMSTVTAYPDPLSPTTSTSSAMKLGTHMRILMILNQEMKTA